MGGGADVVAYDAYLVVAHYTQLCPPAPLKSCTASLPRIHVDYNGCIATERERCALRAQSEQVKDRDERIEHGNAKETPLKFAKRAVRYLGLDELSEGRASTWSWRHRIRNRVWNVEISDLDHVRCSSEQRDDGEWRTVPRATSPGPKKGTALVSLFELRNTLDSAGRKTFLLIERLGQTQ